MGQEGHGALQKLLGESTTAAATKISAAAAGFSFMVTDVMEVSGRCGPSLCAGGCKSTFLLRRALWDLRAEQTLPSQNGRGNHGLLEMFLQHGFSTGSTAGISGGIITVAAVDGGG